MKNLGRQLAMTGIYTLAVLGSFVIAAIVNVILEAGGLSDDMALGIALIVWVILLAGSVFGILSLYKSTGDRVETGNNYPGINSPAGPSTANRRGGIPGLPGRATECRFATIELLGITGAEESKGRKPGPEI